MKLTALIHFILLFAFSVSTYAVEWHYEDTVGFKACANCHKTQNKKWKTTKHHASYKEFHKLPETKKIADIMGVKKIRKPDSLCAGCHYTVQAKGNKPKVKSGISCESCHSPAKNWLKSHQPKGKGVNRKFEAPHDRDERHASVKKLGMIIPSDVYGFANNCMSCHLAPNEKLINVAKHASGSDFLLLERLEKVRHGPKPDQDQKNLILVVGYAVELEHSLSALANSQEDGNFRSKMLTRSYVALANLKAINQLANTKELTSLLSQLPTTFNPDNKPELDSASQLIKKTAKALSDNKAGPLFNGVAVHRHIKTATVPKTSNKTAPSLKKKVEPTIEAAIPSAPVIVAPAVVIPTPEVATPAVSPPKISPPVTPKQESPAPKIAAKPIIKKPAPPKVDVQPIKAAPIKTTPAPTRVKEVTAQPTIQPTVIAKKGSSLITSFTLYTPNSQALCDSDNPWLLGRLAVDKFTKLASESCFAAEIKVQPKHHIFLISKSSNSAPLVMLPDECGVFGPMIDDSTIFLPNSNNALGALKFDKGEATESFYLVAIEAASVAQKFSEYTSSLQNACGRFPTKFGNQSVMEFIKAFSSANAGVEWTLKEVNHH